MNWRRWQSIALQYARAGARRKPANPAYVLLTFFNEA
jgi:hypothetical protein